MFIVVGDLEWFEPFPIAVGNGSSFSLPSFLGRIADEIGNSLKRHQRDAADIPTLAKADEPNESLFFRAVIP